MRKSIALVALALSAVMFVGTQPALAAGSTSESIPGYSGVTVGGTCGFTATVDQRDPRTLTTWTDRRGSIALQTIRIRTTTQYAGTIVFVGRGAIWGTDTSLDQSFLRWVTGVVLMKGTFDVKTGVFLVSSTTILGQVTPLCDALTTGLKPRH